MASGKLFRAVTVVTMFSVITRALSFLFKIYLSRTLGAEVMGLYQIALSMFFLFSALSASGLQTVLSRKTAELRAVGKTENIFTLFSATFLIGSGIATATFLIILLCRPILPDLMSDARSIPLFLLMSPALITTCIYSTVRSWFWGNKQFTYFGITETVEEVLRILFTLLFVSGIVSNISGAYGVALAFTVSDAVVALILLVLYFVKGGRLARPTLAAARSVALPALPLSVMRVFGGLVGTILALMLPARLVASGISVAEATAGVGRIAGMANPLLFAPNALIGSLAVVLIPEMSESRAKQNFAVLNRHINGGISFGIVVSGLFFTVYAALGIPLTELLFADTLAGEYLRYAAFTMLLTPINIVLGSALNSIGAEKDSFYSFAFGTVLMLIAFYFLPRYLGLYSVIAANALYQIASIAGNAWFLAKKTKVSFRFPRTLLLVTVIALPAIYFTSLLYGLLRDVHTVLALTVAAPLGAGMYLLLSYVFGLIETDGFRISSVFPRKKSVKRLTTP